MKAAEYILRLRSDPAGRDRLGREPLYRLRLLLKRLLRDHGFRCVELRDGVEDHEATQKTVDK
ncbi:MAG: hypothetical protein IT450_02245 [Phycisphaerales bacterium]|nr:hypothetical protein [Phycisphaerales bacterium]